MVDLSPLITALTTSITPIHIVSVLASFIGIGMTFVLMWFGIRKLVDIFSSAVMVGGFANLREIRSDMKYQQERSKQLKRDWGK